MNKKRRYSLGFKIYNFIIVLVFAIACFSIIAGYREHVRTTDGFYSDLAENIAETVSNTINGTEVKLLLDAAQAPEYREIYAKANEIRDSSLITDYLDRKDLLLAYENINEICVQYTRYMDVKYIYIEYIGDGYFCRLIDPDEVYFSYGYTAKLDPPFEKYSGRNDPIPPTISRSEDGLLTSCYEPIYDSEGTAVALVGVDVSMEELRAKHRNFAIASILNALFLASLAAVLGVFFIRKHVTQPLKKLSHNTRHFVAKTGQFTEEDIIKVDIQSKDEIEDLYREIRSMEKRIVNYLGHLVKVTGEKERVRTELGIASQIQSGMLPRKFPAFPERDEFDLYASMDPAKEVGGDFYDFFLLDDDHLVLTIADVSGKGIPAALFMAIAKSLLKVMMEPGDTPSKILTKLNNQIVSGNESGMFVTVWLGILELSTGILTAASAGHEYPALSRAGQPFEILKDKHGLVLAAMEGVQYKDYQLQLRPGDRLFVYTDGVVEATSENTALFGIDRMIEALNREPGAGPQALIREVTASIDAFVGKAPQFDDITMLCVTYKPDEA